MQEIAVTDHRKRLIGTIEFNSDDVQLEVVDWRVDVLVSPRGRPILHLPDTSTGRQSRKL